MDTHTVWTSPRVERLVSVLLIVGAVFIALLAIDAFRGLFEPEPYPSNTITVEATGTATVIPDIATISFTVTGESTTAGFAQEDATKKINVATALLGDLGIAKEDVKTTSYSINPKYAWPAPCYQGPCPYQEQRITGYTVSQTVEVKVRDTGEVGSVLSKLGEAGVSNLYGPSFEVEDEDSVKAEARKQAIEKAQEKAEMLAQNLNVRLVRVVSFNEDTAGYPVPYYRDGGFGAAAMEKVAIPEIPVGENEVLVHIYVTYEIR